MLGLDVNQWIRLLNPNQTFLISTQFFYKHIIDAGSGNVMLHNCDPTKTICLNPNREVLPVPALAPYNVPLVRHRTLPFRSARPSSPSRRISTCRRC